MIYTLLVIFIPSQPTLPIEVQVFSPPYSTQADCERWRQVIANGKVLNLTGKVYLTLCVPRSKEII